MMVWARIESTSNYSVGEDLCVLPFVVPDIELTFESCRGGPMCPPCSYTLRACPQATITIRYTDLLLSPPLERTG